jgi:hypothetical protein
MGATESDPAEASLRFPLLLAQRKKWAVVAVVWFTGWADKWAGGSRAFFFFFFFFFSFYLFLSLLNCIRKVLPRQCIWKVSPCLVLLLLIREAQLVILKKK